MSGRKYFGKATGVYYGAVTYARAGSPLGAPGVQVTPELFVKNFGAIALAVATAVAASQTITSPAAAVINGTLASAGVATFVTPRNVVAAWTNTAIITIVGTDEYGSIMTETSASGTSHTGKKAFKTITSITPNATVTGFTAGNGTVIGLPYRADVGDVLSARQTGANDAATVVAADTTSPATGTTGDVRGTVAFASAPDGTKTYKVLLKVADPSTKVGAYGVLQFGSADGA